MVLIKNCGMNSADAVDAAVMSGASFLGFVLYPPSPRAVTAEEAAALSAPHQGKVQRVAVMVDPSDDELDAMLSVWRPEIIQLHGAEMPGRVLEVKERTGCQIIKAFGVATKEDLIAIADYADSADMLLMDAKDAVHKGGTGEVFDWNVLKELPIRMPWFLSGGLNLLNIDAAIAATGAQMVDISSGIESERGVKDLEKIIAFNRKTSTL